MHPFDDGNGRLTRALTDLALAQAQPQTIRFYTMSASIWADRAGYYRILESTQKRSLHITAWLQWFLSTLHDSLIQAWHRINRLKAKGSFWQNHCPQSLSADQMKVLNRLLDGGEHGFEQGINTRQYQAVAKVSKATTDSHLIDLVERGYLRRLPDGGRSTRYEINIPATDTPLATRPCSTQSPST
ncbi:Fic family protein [Stenotrophomonas sp. JC08]|uniref:Fic family protein n=1 Tax=Stenotrophomonas TaxID=40323 RepID=UPI000A80C208|nr:MULTISPECIES: hypothetical protein [Stenotrophomonas]